MFIKRNYFATWLLGGMLTLATSLCMAVGNEVTVDQVVSALESTFGVHQGERRNHIKGTCAV